MAEKPSAKEQDGKRLALVIAGTAAVYLVIQVIGYSLSWSPRVMGFFDLATLAIFGWAFLSAWMIWRKSRNETR